MLPPCQAAAGSVITVTGEEILQLLASAGFGILSAVFPVINAETYVAASQVTALAGPIPVAVGVGIGQSLGKLLVFLGVRRGRDIAFFKTRREKAARVRVGPVRQRFQAVMAKLLELVGSNRWGLPITFLAAMVGLPPLYAVAVLAGATRMRAGWFYLVVLVGRVARFVAVALGIGWLPLWG